TRSHHSRIGDRIRNQIPIWNSIRIRIPSRIPVHGGNHGIRRLNHDGLKWNSECTDSDIWIVGHVHTWSYHHRYLRRIHYGPILCKRFVHSDKPDYENQRNRHAHVTRFDQKHKYLLTFKHCTNSGTDTEYNLIYAWCLMNWQYL